MDRRTFLQASAALLGSAAIAPAQAPVRTDDLKKFKITRVTGFTHTCPRPKMAGKNARLDVHGRQTRDAVLRVATDQGVEGVGEGRATPEVARRLLGRTLDEFWKPGVGVESPLGRS